MKEFEEIFAKMALDTMLDGKIKELNGILSKKINEDLGNFFTSEALNEILENIVDIKMKKNYDERVNPWFAEHSERHKRDFEFQKQHNEVLEKYAKAISLKLQ